MWAHLLPIDFLSPKVHLLHYLVIHNTFTSFTLLQNLSSFWNFHQAYQETCHWTTWNHHTSLLQLVLLHWLHSLQNQWNWLVFTCSWLLVCNTDHYGEGRRRIMWDMVDDNRQMSRRESYIFLLCSFFSCLYFINPLNLIKFFWFLFFHSLPLSIF